MGLVGRRSLILAAVVILSISGAFLLEILLSLRPDRPFGHTPLGHLTGWVGLALMAPVFGYPLRKRVNADHRWPRRWFQVHMLCGVAGPLLILIHSGAHFHALVPILVMLAMALVVISGIVGQALHYLAVRALHERRHELAHQGLSDAEIEAGLHRMAAQEETFRFWQYVHGPVTITFLAFVVLHVVGALYFRGF